ncbi:MAG: bifunctional UDP-N-acetylglucosamine diphosphorylase/glucosamine-1-phosphate N-acetyltransferase GlmU [Vicinamibacterales bacterium]
MANADIHLVVLAAGKGTRMQSALPKILHTVAGVPLIEHVLRAADGLNPASSVIVVGHHADRVREALGKRLGLRFALQEPQLGTAHALLQAEPALAGARGTLLLLYGDVPLLRGTTLAGLVAAHRASGAAATVLTARVDNPHGYGRIVRENGQITAIVEEKDATAAERAIQEINTGIYAFELAPLFGALRSLGSANAQAEYYLPDIIRAYRARGFRVATQSIDDPREILGVNSRKELADVAAIVKTTRAEALMAAGVTIIDPASTWIGLDVSVGPDTIIHPNVHLEGRTRIGARCEIESWVRIVDSAIEDGAHIRNFCVVTESRVAADARVGPFAHIRPESQIGPAAHVGNFVELKKTTLGAGAKANHLAYLGDATVGERVNVGAGTITCNYDGSKKHATVIEDGAFIGSDTQLIAPVRVGKGAYVAAGSSITQDVPDGALGIARGRQSNVEGWVERKKGSGTKD